MSRLLIRALALATGLCRSTLRPNVHGTECSHFEETGLWGSNLHWYRIGFLVWVNVKQSCACCVMLCLMLSRPNSTLWVFVEKDTGVFLTDKPSRRMSLSQCWTVLSLRQNMAVLLVICFYIKLCNPVKRLNLISSTMRHVNCTWLCFHQRVQAVIYTTYKRLGTLLFELYECFSYWSEF